MNILNQTLFQKTKWNWNETFPGKTGTLSLILRKGGDAPITFEATGDSGSYEFDLAEDKTDIPHGTYIAQYQIDGSILFTTQIKISPNLLSTTDPRTQDEINLATLENAYARLSTREVDEITLRGKTLKYRDREKLRSEIYQLKLKLGKIKRPRIVEVYE